MANNSSVVPDDTIHVSLWEAYNLCSDSLPDCSPMADDLPVCESPMSFRTRENSRDNFVPSPQAWPCYLPVPVGPLPVPLPPAHALLPQNLAITPLLAEVRGDILPSPYADGTIGRMAQPVFCVKQCPSRAPRRQIFRVLRVANPADKKDHIWPQQPSPRRAGNVKVQTSCASGKLAAPAEGRLTFMYHGKRSRFILTRFTGSLQTDC